jgi:hypothetical protein
MSTIAAFGAAVAWVGVAGVVAGWVAGVDAGSAARTGAAMVKARRLSGSRENFNIVISELGRIDFVASRTEAVYLSSCCPRKVTIVIFWP